MPRGVAVTRVLPKLAARQPQPLPKRRGPGPKLYNAKRAIPVSRPLTGTPQGRIALEKLRKDPFDEGWRDHVSEDVTQFVDDMDAQGTKLLPEEQLKLVQNPAHYFSRPQHVPTSLRKQIYFPNFSVGLKRTSRYGPSYAEFEVPLWFNKLDMKSYLAHLYNVEVVHIRSAIKYSPLQRTRPSNPYSRGTPYRTRPKKSMTVQLAEPFTYPKVKNIEKKDFDADQFYAVTEAQRDEQERRSDIFGTKLDEKHRKSIAEQAREMLEGKLKWSPTWQHLPETRRMMMGSQTKPERTGSSESRLS